MGRRRENRGCPCWSGDTYSTPITGGLPSRRIGDMTAGYLPIADAARYVGRSPRWIRRRISQIAHFRPEGGALPFPAEDLDAYLDRFRSEPSHAVAARVAPDIVLGGLS